MEHRIKGFISDSHPYEIIEVELMPKSIQEKDQLEAVTESVQDYLLLYVNALEVLESNPPFFIIKRVKDNIGFGT
ncbi:MAG: hypothetical protein H0W84_14795 [Bacteroidetes bacterium]|nr:hypothetical protein [Bacteroidota bacterium]